MSDLISRRELLEAMCNGCDMEACDGLGMCSTAKCYSIRLVEEAPTAYDVDKVVEQLHKVGRNYYPPIDSYCLSQKAIRSGEAISIVKAGGADE